MEETKAPVFIKIDEYKDIVDIITLLREKTHQAKLLLDKVADLKKQEDNELNAWSKELEDVEERIMRIDKALFEPSL